MGWGNEPNNIKQYLIIFAYQMALNETTVHGAYTGYTNGLGSISYGAEHIKEYIRDIYDEKNPDFYELAEQLREDFKDHPGFTFGHIQRLINTTAKYMYLGTYQNLDNRNVFKCCHCPMDKDMIHRITSGYKQLMDDYPDEIDRDCYYFIINGKKSHAWDAITWNTIDFDIDGINSIEVYNKFQEMARILAEALSKDSTEEILPIELSIIDWDIPKHDEFKKKTIIKNQAEGIAAAKAKGVKFGRPTKALPKNFDEIYRLYKAGQITGQEAADRLKMAPSTFWYKIKKYEQEKLE